MNRDETQLRQQRLLLRSAQLRHAITDQAQGLKPALTLADRLHAGVSWVRNNPLVPVAALLVMVLLRPARALRWGATLWSAWKLFRQLNGWAVDNGLVAPSPRGGRHVRSR